MIFPSPYGPLVSPTALTAPSSFRHPLPLASHRALTGFPDLSGPRVPSLPKDGV